MDQIKTIANIGTTTQRECAHKGESFKPFGLRAQCSA